MQEIEMKKILKFMLSEKCKCATFYYEYENKNFKFQKLPNFITIKNKNNYCLFNLETKTIIFNFDNKNYFNEIVAKAFNKKYKNLIYLIRYGNLDRETKKYNNLYFDEDLYDTIIGELFNEKE